MNEEKAMLYTIGHNGHGGLHGLIDVLKEHQIELVIDVRRRAWSAHPGYRKNTLSETLHENTIRYKHVPEVGPSTEILNWWKHIQSPTLSDWEEYCRRYFDMDIEVHIESLADLILELNKTCCLLCAEHDPDWCHRSLLAHTLRDKIDDFESNTNTATVIDL